MDTHMEENLIYDKGSVTNIGKNMLIIDSYTSKF